MGHRKDNIEMICSVGELSALFKQSHSIAELLQSTVRIVANHMQAAVCSIYLLDETREELILRATQGLNPETIGQVRLKNGEGLTGLALQQLRPIREGRGAQNPHFKFFPGTHEERYEAFLAVPITQGLNRIGVLVVQDPAPDYFDEHDTLALRAIASQLATIIENARLLITLHQPPPTEASETADEPARFLRGKPASPGIAHGRARFKDHRSRAYTARPPPDPPGF